MFLFMVFTIEVEREEDGRWIAFVVELRGVHAYGATPDDAVAAAQALALQVLADELAHGERDARTLRTVSFVDRAA
jgi:predicted RNase H-like HicB family nuclease